MGDGREYTPEEIAKFKAIGIEVPKEIPVFPFVPDSIKEGRSFCVIEAGELESDADIQELMRQLWDEPEVDIRYYMGHNGEPSADGLLLAARNRGDIRMDEMERRYYRHPVYERNYVRIVPKGENEYNWDWEKKVVEAGPEFWRVTLTLSQRKRDEFDAWRKVQLEEHYRQQARKAQYAYDVFLSFAMADSAEAKQVHDKIVAANRSVFMAPKALQPGVDFAEQIRLALIGARELWLLVSPSSSQSEWVTTEWGAAWVLGKRIVPILHRCAPDILPARLAKLQCIDFYRCGELVEQLSQVVDPRNTPS